MSLLFTFFSENKIFVSIVKRLLTEYADYFAGELFMQLTVANSISWPRIAAQIAMHTNVYCQAVHAGHVEFGEGEK